MPRDIWFTSDPHFGHDNIIEYASRPFSNTEEMDENLVWHWNRVVKPEDLVYCLGDFAWTAAAAKRIRPQLNGSIRLIIGNHDEVLKLAQAGLFQRMEMWKQFREFGFTASHLPLMPEQIRHGFVSVHGHVHNEASPCWNQINLSVEVTNYEPVHFDWVLDLVREKQKIGKEMGYEWHPKAPADGDRDGADEPVSPGLS